MHNTRTWFGLRVMLWTGVSLSVLACEAATGDEDNDTFALQPAVTEEPNTEVVGADESTPPATEPMGQGGVAEEPMPPTRPGDEVSPNPGGVDVADPPPDMVSSSDGGTTSPTSEPPPEPLPEPSDSEPSAIAGTYTSCTSYTEASDGMCANYYCATTVEGIERELTGAGACADLSAETVCAGKTSRVVAQCTRSIKSNPFNLGLTDEQLRTRTTDCAYENAEVKALFNAACLDCLVTVALCASNNCLTACLTGNSPACDRCRLENNCDQMAPDCTGLPNPF